VQEVQKEAVWIASVLAVVAVAGIVTAVVWPLRAPMAQSQSPVSMFPGQSSPSQIRQGLHQGSDIEQSEALLSLYYRKHSMSPEEGLWLVEYICSDRASDADNRKIAHHNCVAAHAVTESLVVQRLQLSVTSDVEGGCPEGGRRSLFVVLVAIDSRYQAAQPQPDQSLDMEVVMKIAKERGIVVPP
jgi:hypothetical protein